MLDSKEYMRRLEERRNSPEYKLNRLRQQTEVVLCESCNTFQENLTGAREPDYEGRCSNCGEESNWTVVNILDYKDRILELLNEHGE